MKPKNTVATLMATLLTIFLLAGCSPKADNAQAAPNNETAAQNDTSAQADTATATAVDHNLTASDPAVQAALDGSLAGIYDLVNPSVVHIQVVGQAAEASVDPSQIPQIPGFPNLPFSQLPQDQTPLRGEGSGFVWDTAGHIVTNNHVVANASKITVIFADDRTVTGTVVGTDPDSDLAVVQVDVPADSLQPVQIGDSTAVRVGDLAIAIGDPFGQAGTMTVGIISALGRLLPTHLDTLATGPSFNIPDIIQTDAAINPGNSGGVLLNAQGDVVGVTSAIISPAGASSGIGFAIPAATVQAVVPALISDGYYNHPYLGISGSSLTPELAEAMDLPTDQQGALVGDVVADGPAEQAGLQGSDTQIDIDGAPALVGGDVITAIDGRPVHNMDDLITNLSRYGQVGQDSTLTILRDGQEQDITVTLMARPQSSSTETAETPNNNRARLGIVGMALTPEAAQAMELDENQQGVLIVQVQPDSGADVAGLRGSDSNLLDNGQQIMIGGDVITAVAGQAISDVPELQTIIAQAQPGDKLELTILRDGKEMQLSVTLGE